MCGIVPVLAGVATGGHLHIVPVLTGTPED